MNRAIGARLQQVLSSSQLSAIIDGSALSLIFGYFYYLSPQNPSDFSAFYVAGSMALNGLIRNAYHAEQMFAELTAFCGRPMSMPWTYPPPFDLLVEFLALLPIRGAYLVFVLPPYILYSLTLRKLSASPLHFNVSRLICIPSIFVTILSGQNSLLTASLIGLFCCAFLAKRKTVGIPLGLLVIKPHLTAGLLFLCVLKRAWAILAMAGVVALGLSILATVLFGVEVWTAFLGALSEAGRFLSTGQYQFFRMTSPYAAVFALSKSFFLAAIVQGLSAILCVMAILFAYAHGWDIRLLLGVSVLASYGFSPYVYDYDLTGLGVASALLLPAIMARASIFEKITLPALAWCATGYGLRGHWFGVDHTTSISGQSLPVSGLAYILLVAAVFNLIRRTPVKARRGYAAGEDEVKAVSDPYARDNPG